LNNFDYKYVVNSLNFYAPQDVFMAWCLVKHRNNFTLPYIIFKCAESG